MKTIKLFSTLAIVAFTAFQANAQFNNNGTNVGIGTAAPANGFGSTATNVRLYVDGGVETSIKGATIAQQFTASSIYSSTNSVTSGYIGYNSNWAAGSSTYGITTNAIVSTARSSFNPSNTFGARFITDLGATSGSNPHRIGGVYGILKGAWNGASTNGGFAGAVVGADEINGNATYAGHFTGKGYFSGKVSIGTTNIPTSVGGANVSAYKLFVEGGVLAEEIRVRTGWADYVFADDYTLKPLAEVEAFIKENKHLPNVPSANTVETQGIELGDMSRIQQEKIEELTLYLIDQQKQIDELKSMIEALSKSK